MHLCGLMHVHNSMYMYVDESNAENTRNYVFLRIGLNLVCLTAICLIVIVCLHDAMQYRGDENIG